MKRLLKKAGFPLAVVIAAAVQTFGMDLSRLGFAPVGQEPHPDTPTPDTVIYENRVYTKFRKGDDKAVGDTLEGIFDTTATDGPLLTARDTIKAPDSLRLTDPFRYRYYVALLDSLTHKLTVDSLKAAGDSLDWPRIDSLYYADSAATARRKFQEWYDGLDKNARKRYDYDQKMKRKQREMDSLFAIKDSLQAIKDSIRENTPRILETFSLPDSLYYKRLVTWNRDALFSRVEVRPKDTTFNYTFNDYPFMKEDVGATYLGIVGSPVRTYDFFKRNSVDKISFYEPYETYSFSPSTLPMYNTKTPYTELAYWGTLLANTENEEADVHILTTQNILPELNLMLQYDRYGANGMLTSEDTDNRTFVAAGNYIGRRYQAHAGFIRNSVRKSENGGIVDNFWIRDTTVGSREIAVHLTDADTRVVKNTYFLDQKLRIPMTFITNLIHGKDTTAADTGFDRDGTTAFIGHSSEFSTFRKIYLDKIGQNDRTGRDFYHDNFFIHPTQSNDSLRVMKIENKVFAQLQPWAADAVVSTLDVGIGNRIQKHYLFRPEGWLYRPSDVTWNSTYLYGGVGGQLREAISWNAQGYYTFLGQEINDLGLSAEASLNLYPFRRHRKSPLSFSARFETTLDEPDFYVQHYFSNHYKWENDFGKISTTKLEARLAVPHWDLEVTAGYALLDKNIYYDTLGIVRQNVTPMSVAKIGLMKNFQFGNVHLDNRALVQLSSDQEVMPLPLAALNLRWYFQFNIVSADIMKMQIGANVLWTTKWYAPGYSPALGLFYNQREEQFGGGSPYIDAFVNVQWKRATVFVKLVNANMGWPMDSADYFSAAGFIRSQRAIKFGVWWPFYTQPHKNSSVSDRAGSSPGGNGGSGGMGSIRNGLGGGMSAVRNSR